MKKTIVIDVDGTLCETKTAEMSYEEAVPKLAVIEKLHLYKTLGFSITIFTARNMNTFNGDIEQIKLVSLPILSSWLDKHGIPYDEIIIGKPWSGKEGFYVDDLAIRPDEFVRLSPTEVSRLLSHE